MVARVSIKSRRDPYVLVLFNGKKEREHVAIAETAMGMPLPAGAEVHHFDENKKNNARTNLVICPSRAYHFLLHRRQRALAACGNADWIRCSYCKKHDDPAEIFSRTNKRGRFVSYHPQCHLDDQRARRAKLGMKALPRISGATKEKIRAGLLAGEKCQELAAIHGVSEVTVYRLREKTNEEN